MLNPLNFFVIKMLKLIPQHTQNINENSHKVIQWKVVQMVNARRALGPMLEDGSWCHIWRRRSTLDKAWLSVN